MRALPVLLLLLPLPAACSPEAGQPDLPGGSETQPFAGIAEAEVVHFTGTEPFWGGEVSGGTLRYATPEDPEGSAIAVTRFAGRGGLSFSGTLGARGFDMTVTPARCSDGMSDRTYPFAVTLHLGDEQREGCAWTDSQPPGEGAGS